ncbi:hypothetical protein MSUIS_02080 [Mycoplasma suis KI3806]|uniref:Uncharacterized protein n=1 Tax=Mycoplasma suis (strain KI_3806) TaxID=708248 RepID=F0V379_MYCS3|nr:hypothetical protein [Mycoplasma suis]CBZ40301.1 hypothetical protein MSUIS_02080 [Mycoplasma suis KI3806]
MLGFVSWWAKAALITFSLGGALGGGYLLRGNFFKGPEETFKKPKKVNDYSGNYLGTGTYFQNMNTNGENCERVEDSGVEILLDCIAIPPTNKNRSGQGRGKNQVEAIYKVDIDKNK